MATSASQHSVMVFPANGAMGYDICRDLCQGEKKNMCKQVLAICCGKGGWHDKLKDLGKHVKVMVIDKPDSMDSWKHCLKDERCDCVMVCMDPTAAHPEHMGRMETDSMNEMAKAMECCVEMSSHMHCKCMCACTACGADDARYKMWHQMYQAVEKAGSKHYKSNQRCMVMHNMVFECLMSERQQIKEQKQLMWPVSADAQCCPLAMCDVSCCCVDCMMTMCRSMGTTAEATIQPTKQHLSGCYCATGHDMMTPQMMCEMMAKSLSQEVQFQQVSGDDWKNLMKGRLSPMEMCCGLEMFEMMQNQKMSKCTNDVEKITGKAPMTFDKWMSKHESDFRV